MEIWIHWTDKSEDHIARHGVDPREVEEAVESPYWTLGGRNDSTILLGRTYGGRHLTIVMVPAADEHDSWYIATARDMTFAERRTFKRRCSGHG